MALTAAATLDHTFAALADPIRRSAVELLAQHPRRSGELASELGTTPSAMSKHLRVLRERIYSLRSATMVELRSWLDTTERGWAAQLPSFAEHIEQTG